MAKIDNKFDYLGLNGDNWDFTDKSTCIKQEVLYMFNRSIIMFKYHNLPDSIPAQELERLIQSTGTATVGKINGDLYAVNAGLGGEGDVYNRPTVATVSVPYLNYSANWGIGKDCVVVQNDSFRMGLYPLFVKYCTMLHENNISMILSSINKRVQSLISANDDITLASANKFIDDLYRGKLTVVAESKLFDSLKTSPIATANTTNLKDLFEYHQYLKASLYNEIGLSANFNMKRERLTESEVEANTDNLYPLVDDMLDCRRSAIEQINQMFDTDIQVEFNSSWDYRIFNGASIHNVENEVEKVETLTEQDTEQGTEQDTEQDTEQNDD